MTAAAVNTALEIANWFFKRAEKDNIYLQDDKLQHLMFLAQVHFALAHQNNYLFPGLFAAGPDGYVDPNLQITLSFGRPLMANPKFSDKINAFLELIWNKYSPLDSADLSDLILNTTAHRENYKHGEYNLIPLHELAAQFKTRFNTARGKAAARPHKVMISQNGPVVVSRWQPRKINSENIKEI